MGQSGHFAKSISEAGQLESSVGPYQADLEGGKHLGLGQGAFIRPDQSELSAGSVASQPS